MLVGTGGSGGMDGLGGTASYCYCMGEIILVQLGIMELQRTCSETVVCMLWVGKSMAPCWIPYLVATL